MTLRDLLLASPARSLLVGGGALVALAAVMLAGAATPPVEPPALAIEAREPVAVTAVRDVALEDEAEGAEEPEAADPLDSIQDMDPIEDPADFTFLVEVGGKIYVRIAELAVDSDRDDAELYAEDGVTSAVAPISASALPEELRPWSGRRVLVNGTCAATVVAFAEIGRVSGDPYFASPDEDRAGASWTAETAFSHGSTMIAGELDRDCPGSWARAADRPAVGRALAVADPRLERAARGAFLASSGAERIAADWREAKQPGDWRDHITLDVRVVEHSRTGARWAYVHAYKNGACGEYGVNHAAIYQVADDGALTQVKDGHLDGAALEDLVDLNGDGWFEQVVAHEDENDRSLVGPADSASLATIGVPLHGCGC